MKIDQKKLIPIVIAILSFLLISILYFKPVVLDKKELKQGDIVNFKGFSKEITDYRESKGEEALWTNSMFGGMPAYQISVKYENNWMQYFDKIFRLGLPHPAGIVFLYFIGFFILLLCMNVDPWLAIAGSIAYGFSSYFFIILEAGHNSKAVAIGYMAPLLGSILYTLRGNKLWGGALVALFMGLELYANHVQITYYLFILVFVLMLFELADAIRKQKIKDFLLASAFIVSGLVIGILPNISNLWATYEYGKYSTRGKSELTIDNTNNSTEKIATDGLDKDYATQWSYGIGESFTLLIPNFKGGASETISKNYNDQLKKADNQYKDFVSQNSAYFGDQPFTSGPVYAGAIVCFLALLGMFLIQHPIKWVLLIGTLLSISLSWGKNFMGLSNFFFDHVPLYNKFRAVSMILVIAELTLPLLAVLGLQEILNRFKNNSVDKSKAESRLLSSVEASSEIAKKQMAKPLYLTIGIVGGFILLNILSPTLFNNFQGEQEFAQLIAQVKQSDPSISSAQIESTYGPAMDQVEEVRKSIFKKDALRSLFFILLSGTIVLLFVNNKISKVILISGLAVLFLIDMWAVDARYLNKENYVSKSQNNNPYTMSTADEIILQDQELYVRTLKLGNPFNDASTSYFHKSIGGYHGAKLKRYKEIIDFYLEAEHNRIIGVLKAGVTDSIIQDALSKNSTMNMLNTKYIIYDPQSPPLINRNTLGNAWFVKEIKMTKDANEEILALKEINPKFQSVVNIQNSNELGAKKFDGEGSIKLISYSPKELVYESSAASSQFAVFSEIYYPKGWNAYIDGKPSVHTCVNYILRGMAIPGGKHKIEFKFEPKVFQAGEKVALFGSILLIGFLGLGAFSVRKNKEN